MPTSSKKEKQQVLILGLIMVCIVGYLLYSYGDKLVPKAIIGTLPPPEPPRLNIPAPAGKDLFDRKDFQALHPFADLPIKPLSSGGSSEPFVTEIK